MSLLSARRPCRSLLLSAAAFAIATACSVTLTGTVASTPVQLASTAISIQGTGGGNATSLHGILKDWPYTNYGVTQEINDKYPASVFFMGDSVNQGADNLTTIANATPGKKVVIGVSQGAVVETVALQRWQADPSTAPSPEDTILILIANPDTPGNGLLAQTGGFYNPLVQLRHPGPTPTDSPYTVVIINRQYDFFADQPNDHTNLLADANAVAGLFVIHPFYGDVDMSNPDIQVKTVGKTTFYLIPTKRLPILAPLYAVADVVHQGSLVDKLDPPLRAVIDSAYDRDGYQTQGSLQQEQPTAVTKPKVRKPAVPVVMPHISATVPRPKGLKPMKPGDAVKALVAHVPHPVGSLPHPAKVPGLHHGTLLKPSHASSGGGRHSK